MKLPVRVGLRVGIDGPACSFTAHFAFSTPPHKGDKLLLTVPGQGQVGMVVADLCHFIPVDEEPVSLVICTPLLLENYDQLLQTLDWFKATYEVEDFDADSEPELYYKFYRNLIHVLDLTKVAHPLVAYDPVEIKIFAEACRAVLLAELKPDEKELSMAMLGFNPTIKHLHELVLSRKKEEPDGASMLAIIKIWEPLLNQKKMMAWKASVEDCLAYARVVFARLPSIPSGKLPTTLRTE